ERAPDDNRLKELERRAGTAAGLIQAALEGAERSALDGLSRLTGLLTTPVGDARTNAKELRRLLSIALADLLMASNLDGAAIYQFRHQRSQLELVTAHLRVAAPTRIEREDSSTPWEAALSKTVADSTGDSDLHPIATYALGQPDEPHGYLIVLSRDRLATVRRAPSTDEMLKAGALLIGGALASHRPLAAGDVLVYVAHSWQPVLVGPMPAGDHSDVIAGGVPVQAAWTEVPVVYANGMVLGSVLTCLIGEKDRARSDGEPPFTLAGEIFDRGGHKDLIRVFVPFGSDTTRRATGVLEVGYHRTDQRRPDWGQIEALRAAAGQLAVAVETARLYEEAQRHAEQLELVADVSKAIASSIDLEQTLRLVAQNLA